MSSPMTLPDLPQLEITTADALWSWLAAHHARDTSQLLVTWKAATPEKYVSRDAVLDALVAHGWIDGRRWTHSDPARTIQLIAPRKQRVWAKSYKDRAARLSALGRMHPVAEAAFRAAQADPAWSVSDPVDALRIPGDLAVSFDPNGAAWFAKAAPSYKRNVLRFLEAAKRPETRQKRIALIAQSAGRQEKLPNY